MAYKYWHHVARKLFLKKNKENFEENYFLFFLNGANDMK